MYGQPQKGPVPVRQHLLYRRWSFMKQVCYNPNHADYKSYGAKGIEVSPDFAVFWEFVDLVETHIGYPAGFNRATSKLWKLARIDQDGDYTLKNLEWSVAKEVGRRCAKTYKLKYKNKTRPLKEWSEVTGINFHTMLGRIDRGWKPAEVLGYKYRAPRSK